MPAIKPRAQQQAVSAAPRPSLAPPTDSEPLRKLIDEDQVAETVVCGPDPERHLEAIREYEHAGYDHVWVHQVGRDQDSFLRFYTERILPAF